MLDNCMQAILTWIKSNVDTDDQILDIGCGNASLLFQLVIMFAFFLSVLRARNINVFIPQYHLGFTNVIGIDKAPTAIKLATEISHQECAKIKLEVLKKNIYS